MGYYIFAYGVDDEQTAPAIPSNVLCVAIANSSTSSQVFNSNEDLGKQPKPTGAGTEMSSWIFFPRKCNLFGVYGKSFNFESCVRKHVSWFDSDGLVDENWEIPTHYI